VKVGVQPGSPFHVTECFGPVLGVMRASGLEEAIAWQNQVPFGLTAGLAALDPAEIAGWRSKVEAGNLYVNRHTTGAVVGRQPFGGWKRSVMGPAAKAGGPNYVASLGRWHGVDGVDPEAFAEAVLRAWTEDLAPADPASLEAEANTLRHLLVESVVLRVGAGVPCTDVERALATAAALGVDVEVSASGPSVIAPGTMGRPPTVENDEELAERLASLHPTKIRVLGEVSDRLVLAALDTGLWLDDVAVSSDPLAEAMRWVREQVVTETMHRHGDPSSRRTSLRPQPVGRGASGPGR
jgi:RHH-type proline utilization regulon transcriptional repressor/proline dehydrogenase/delta 1-pyrroline-5-carboxylate dehydrogenase